MSAVPARWHETVKYRRRRSRFMKSSTTQASRTEQLKPEQQKTRRTTMSDGTELSPISGETEYTDQYGHEVHLVTHQDGTTDSYTYDNQGGFQEMHIDPTSGTTQDGVTGDGIQYHQDLDSSGTLTGGEYADAQGDTASLSLGSDGYYSESADMADGSHVEISHLSGASPSFAS
jgi:hypothetical protein